MENIVTAEGINAYYVEDDEWTPCRNRKSNTPMYGVIKIDHRMYQCVPGSCNNQCDGCAFYDGHTYYCMNWFLPCSAKNRIDNRDCIYVEILEENTLEEKELYSTKDFEKLNTYRFK